jgi:hypothetical protein
MKPIPSLLLLATIISTHSLAQVPPRAWTVDLDGAQAVIVTETHESFPFEFDEYFYGAIAPFVAEADAVMLEGKLAPSSHLPDGAYCKDEQSLLSKKADRRANDALLSRLTGERRLPARTSQYTYINVTLPFTLEWVSRRKNESPVQSDRASSQSVAEALLRGAPGTAVALPIESMEDRWRAFCSAPADIREAAVMEAVERTSRQFELLRQHAFKQDGIDVYRNYFESVLKCVDKSRNCSAATFDMPAELRTKSGLLALPCGSHCAATNYTLARNRNPAIAKSILNTMRMHRRTVVLIGAAHLPTLQYFDGPGKGIVDLLREAGAIVGTLELRDPRNDAVRSPPIQ